MCMYVCMYVCTYSCELSVTSACVLFGSCYPDFSNVNHVAQRSHFVGRASCMLAVETRGHGMCKVMAAGKERCMGLLLIQVVAQCQLWPAIHWSALNAKESAMMVMQTQVNKRTLCVQTQTRPSTPVVCAASQGCHLALNLIQLAFQRKAAQIIENSHGCNLDACVSTLQRCCGSAPSASACQQLEDRKF